MKLLGADTNLAHFICPIDTALSLKALFFRLTGTNDTGKTVAIDDVGRVKYRVRNTTLVDAEFAMLHHYTNKHWGTAPEDSTIADAFELGIYIPRFWNDGNIENIDREDNAVFEINFDAAYDVEVASGLAELYAIQAEGIQSYNLKMIQYGESFGAAGTFPVTYSMDNILEVALSDLVSSVTTLAASNISRVQYNLGRQNGEASLGALLNITDIEGEIEAAQALIANIVKADGDITARLNDKVDMSFEMGGAGYPQSLVLGALFNPDKLQLTSDQFKHRLFSKEQEAIAQQHTRTVQVLSAMHKAAIEKFAPATVK